RTGFSRIRLGSADPDFSGVNGNRCHRWGRRKELPVRNSLSTATEASLKRCAIYTRKSSEQGLDHHFSSLEAQRSICSSFIASQRPNGWTENPKRYDDGGQSGGSLMRPALQELLADIEAGLVDIIVIYKLDRI